MPPTVMNNEWPKDRLRRVIDVSTGPEFLQEFTEETVRDIFQRHGQISNIYPWFSSTRKAHFYVEFQSIFWCDKAREAVTVPGLHPASIGSDGQHLRRLISLSTQPPKPSNHRYSPYQVRSVSTSCASLPVAVNQSGFASSQYSQQQPYSHPSHSSLLYDADDSSGPMSLDNGLQPPTVAFPSLVPFPFSLPTPTLQMIPETTDGPVLGELVTFPANPASTSSGTSALLPSASDQAMQFETDDPPLITNRTQSSTHHDTPNSRSSEFSVEEMLEVLTEVRNRKAEETGQDASPTAGSRPPPQVQIHPKFDFRQHIQSGRFLISDHLNGSTDEKVNGQSFQLTPLQAYFADIYASLQTELYHTKKRYRQDLLLFQKQRALLEQYKQEAANEREARREAEKALDEFQRQHGRGAATTTTDPLAAEKAQDSLEEAKREVERLKAALTRIGTVYSLAMASKTPP